MLTTPQPDVVRDLRERSEREAKADAERAQRDAGLLDRMSTEIGRQDVWQDLRAMRTTAGRADSAHRWDAQATAYAVGQQDVASALWGRLERACPDLVAQMVSEAMNRLRTTK